MNRWPVLTPIMPDLGAATPPANSLALRCRGSAEKRCASDSAILASGNSRGGDRAGCGRGQERTTRSSRTGYPVSGLRAGPRIFGGWASWNPACGAGPGRGSALKCPPNATNASHTRRKLWWTSLAEMHVQGVSTRKVKAITEELCGHSFSASTISRINKTLDTELKKFATRALEEEYPYGFLRATRRCAKTGSSGAERFWWRSESTGTGGAVCWRWNWRNGKARPVGGNCY